MVSYISTAIPFAIIFLYGCLGEIISEKSGHLNLGLPGVMCMGAFGGCLFVSNYLGSFSNAQNANYFLVVLLSLMGAMVFGTLGGLIYAFLTVSLKCNQNITGLALTTFGSGFASYFMGSFKTDLQKANFTKASKIISKYMPIGDKTGWFGKVFLSYGILVYLAIALCIITTLIFNKTRVGLNLRAVGENPATADAMGVNVNKYKYCSILIGSAIAGIGGIYYIVNNSGVWDNSSTLEAYGWLALALVIFTTWRPVIAIFGAFLFGLLDRFGSFAFLFNIKLNPFGGVLMKILPYLVTIIVLIVTSIIGKKETQPPTSLGQNYFKEDR